MRKSVNTGNKFSAFGSTQPNPNNLNANQYRYGFGGMEQDKQSSSYTTYFRQYDPRIARWKSTDPVTQPWQSPYTAFDNNPIFYTDPSGAIAIPNKRRGIAGGGGIGGIGGALAGSAQTALSLAIRGGMQASMVGTYMQSAMLPTSSATNSGRELGVGNESGLANNLAANDLYACTTCPQPLNESGGTNVQNTLVLPLGTPVMTPTDGIWESLWHTAYPRTYGMQEVDNLGNVASGLQPYTGYPPDMLGGPLRKGDKAIKLGKYLLNDRAWHSVKKTFLSRIGKGKYEKIVGNNPDIDFKGLKIVLKASKNSPYVGKTYETSFTVIEFIEFLFELGVK
ncbi:MAG: hypothetical protein HJHJAOHD_02516 [Flavobacteriales bacterium]|nr:hypothetical protein [Flavobacteriales bacterium]